MKQVRSIRLFFVITAILIIACFWMGFAFGKKSQSKIDLAKYEILSEEQKNSAQLSEDGAATITDEDDTEDVRGSEKEQSIREGEVSERDSTLSDDAELSQQEAEPDETVDGKIYQTPKFYLKDGGAYLTVYTAATDEVYFETDLKKEDLPLELQEDAATGIPFYDLEDLYHFLENYSS